MTKNQMDVIAQLETKRHYQATEAENLRHNLQMENAEQQRINESIRANMASEALKHEANEATKYTADQRYAGTVDSATISSDTSKQVAEWKNTTDKLIASWNRDVKNRELDIKQYVADYQKTLTTAQANKATAETKRLLNEVSYQKRQLEAQLNLLDSQMALNAALEGQAKANESYTRYKKVLESCSLLERGLNDIATQGNSFFKTMSNNRNNLMNNVFNLYRDYQQNIYDIEGIITGWEE